MKWSDFKFPEIYFTIMIPTVLLSSYFLKLIVKIIYAQEFLFKQFSLTQYDTTNKIIMFTRMMTTWFWKWHNTNYSWWSVKWFSAKLSITYDVCNPSAWKVKRNANLTWQYRTYIMQISRGSSFFKRQMNSLAVKNLNLLRRFQLWCVLGCATDLNFHQ